MNKNDITLAAKHQTIVEQFDSQQEQIDKYNAEIDSLKKNQKILMMIIVNLPLKKCKINLI